MYIFGFRPNLSLQIYINLFFCFYASILSSFPFFFFFFLSFWLSCFIFIYIFLSTISFSPFMFLASICLLRTHCCNPSCTSNTMFTVIHLMKGAHRYYQATSSNRAWKSITYSTGNRADACTANIGRRRHHHC